SRRDSVELLAMELRSKLQHIEKRLKSNPMFFMPDSAEIPKNAADLNYHKLLASGVFLTDAADNLVRNIKTFLLPMLYGLLGAYLFVIRRLAKDIKHLDYTWKKSMRNEARLILGLFVGVFFGYLFKVPSLESIAGVTTYVLAFI